MPKLKLILLGVVVNTLCFADSYTLARLTGGPTLSVGTVTFTPWFYTTGIDDAGVGVGYYYSTNAFPPTASPFRVQNSVFYGSPSNPSLGPQEIVSAISSNGLYTAGIYEPLTPSQTNFMYLQQGSSAPQQLALPVDTFGFTTDATSTIVGVNNSGTLVVNVGTSLSGPYSADIISKGVVTTLNFPGSLSGSTQVGGINDNGVVVGNAVLGTPDHDSAFVTFTYKDGVYTTVYSTPYFSSFFEAEGINNSGQIVGIFDPYNIYVEYAGLLDNGVLTNLSSFSATTDDPFPFRYALGINNLGEIIGGDGNGSVILATPSSLSQSPEPTPLALVAMACLASAVVYSSRKFNSQSAKTR